MPKPWQPPTGRLSTKSRPFPEIVKDIRHCVWSVNRLRPEPSDQDKRFRFWNLGSGFFVAPNVFLTCHHVLNGSRNPHQAGDRYQIFQIPTFNNVKQSPQFAPVVGTDLHFFADRDAAILQLAWEPQPYVAVGYSDVFEGFEIGVAGYPLPKIVASPNGDQQLITFRVAKGVITSTTLQGLHPFLELPTIQLQTIEVNFLFVPGNSGGPIFDAETGRVLAYVHGFMDSPIVQRYSDTNQDNIAAGAPEKHIQAIHAVYSLGIKLDAIRNELDGFGAAL